MLLAAKAAKLKLAAGRMNGQFETERGINKSIERSPDMRQWLTRNHKAFVIRGFEVSTSSFLLKEDIKL